MVYIHVCVYTLYKTLYLLFFCYTDCLFLSAFKVIHLVLRAMSDIALKAFIFSFFILSFPLMLGAYKRSNLQQKTSMIFRYCPIL